MSYQIKSTTLPIYKKWVDGASELEIQKADEIYLACEQHYAQGGDTVVECYSPDEVITQLR